MLGFLFVDEARSRLSTSSTTPAATSYARRTTRCRRCETWSTAAIQEALREAGWSRGCELKPRVAFGPVRIAVTGRKVSPPLFESLELLGRERGLGRLAGRPVVSNPYGGGRRPTSTRHYRQPDNMPVPRLASGPSRSSTT